jgi:tetratricopeptide (TPR) repeat protein
MVSARLGEFEQSQEAMRAASQVVRGLNSPMTETDVDLFTGWSYLEMGDPDQGLEYAQRAVQRGISTDKIECICNGYSCVGYGHLRRQDLPEAIEAFHESVRRSMLSGAAQIENTARTGLALAEFMSGRAEAVKDMESTLENARALGDPYTAALLSQTLGESYTQLGDFERAEGYLQAALDYYRPNGMRPYVARTLQSLAALYDKQGCSAEAASARSEAEELARALQT